MDKETPEFCGWSKSIHKRQKVLATRKRMEKDVPVIVRKYVSEDGKIRLSIELDYADFRRFLFLR